MNLFMVELTVTDVTRSATWYRDRLGFTLARHDVERHFALLELGSAKLALKQGTATPGAVRLHFQVENLDAELARWRLLGETVISDPKTSDEGYRRAHIADPDGHPITWFQWIRPIAISPSSVS